jgi:hypothetical protein
MGSVPRPSRTSKPPRLRRCDRGESDQGLLGADREQALAVITAIAAIEDDDPGLAERLASIRAELEQYVATPPPTRLSP